MTTARKRKSRPCSVTPAIPVMTIDRNTEKGWLTAAGLLMFGKGLSVRERFDNIRMDYIDESNLLPGSRWSDKLTYDGMWENNLYNFIRQVTPRLVAGL